MLKARVTSAEGDARAKGAFPPSQSPLASCSLSCTLCLVELPDDFDGVSHDTPDFSLGSLDEGKLLIDWLMTLSWTSTIGCGSSVCEHQAGV